MLRTETVAIPRNGNGCNTAKRSSYFRTLFMLRKVVMLRTVVILQNDRYPPEQSSF
ncbi:hypothetical protein BH10ACI4_BH10ACI4_25380 [soil metagenome]